MKQKQFNKSHAFRFKRFSRKAYSAFNSMHKVVNMGVVVGCAIGFLCTSPATAQDGVNQQKEPEMQEEELEEVMVSASRVEMPINQTAKLVTVISKEQISQAPVQNFQDLLNYLASIDAIQRGGNGVQADISIRGGSADQTAILLNGINISNAQTGHYSLDIPVNLSDIERIEILHGPSALAYGSGAFAGGINIITDKSSKIPIYAKTEVGMHRLKGMEMRGTSKNGILTNTLSAGYNSSDGYIQNSDYSIYNALLQSRLALKNDNKVDFLFGYNEKKYGANTFYSPKFPNQFDETQTYMGSIKGEFGDKLKFVPIVYWNRHHDHFQLKRGISDGENFHRNDTYGANLIVSYRSKIGNTSLGSELRQEDIISSNLGKPMENPWWKYKKEDSRTNASMALEHSYSIRKLILSGGILLNHNSIENNSYNLYPSLSVSYRPMDNLNLYTSWSKSSRVPTFTDLWYTAETHTANEALKAEKSETVDIGIKYKRNFIDVYASAYSMQGRDIIDWVKEKPEDKWASWNHTQIDKLGFEIGSKLYIGELTGLLGKQAYLSVDYARLNQTIDTKALISKYSLNYLRDKITAQFSHKIIENLSAGWYFRYQKRMGEYERIENMESKGMVKYPAFTTLDIRINYKYTNLNFYLNFNNVYDTYYFDLANIPQSGFWLIGGISYTLR